MPFLRPRLSLMVALATVGMGALETAFAADLGSGPPPPPSAPYSQWTLSVTPYAWLPFLQGDVTVKGRTVDIDITPFELLEHLDAVPFMSYIEARKGPLALYNDIFFAKVGVDGSVSRSVRGLTVGADADVDITLAIIEVGGAFEIARWSSGGGGGLKDVPAFQRYTALDVLAGARYWHQDVDIKFALTGSLDLNGLVLTRNRVIARGGMSIGSIPSSVSQFGRAWPPARNCFCEPTLVASMPAVNFPGMC